MSSPIRPSPIPDVPPAPKQAIAADLQQRMIEIIAALPDAVLCFNRDWYMTYANAEAIRISQLDPETFPLRDFWHAYPEAIGTELEERYRTAMASGTGDRFEYYVESLNIWLDITLLPTDEGFAAVYRDISERKQAEGRRIAAADQIRNVFEAMPEGVVTVGPDWCFTFANEIALQFVGRRDIIGKDIFELFPGNLTEPFHSTYRAAMEKRVEGEFEAFHPAPLNTWVKVLAKPFEHGIAIFFADITARKLAELREQEASRKLAQMLELTSDGVVSVDRDWRISFFNENAYRLVDPERKAISRTLWDAFPALSGTPLGEMVRRSMEDRVPGRMEAFYPEPLNAFYSVQSEPSDEGIVIFFNDITEQRQHEKILLDQLQLLQSVQSASRLATWEFDLKAGTLRFGPGSFPVFGHPPEELATREQFRAILLPEHRDMIRDLAVQVGRTGESTLLEFGVTAKDGRTIWIEARAQAVYEEDGRVLLRGMSMDITERRNKEQQLIASEERYRVLADLNPNAIWMGDAQGNVTYANQRALAYIGATLENLATTWLESFAQEDRNRVVERWQRSLETGEEYDIEALLRFAATGEYRYWHLRAAPIRNEKGAILYWLGVGQDVHDSKTYTAALQAEQMEAEKRRLELESIYATSPVGLSLLDPVNLTFLNMNEHEAEMLGGSRAELIGKPLSEIAPPDKVPGLLELMRSVAQGKMVRSYVLEGELASRPGEKRAWSVNYAPVYNQDGTVRAISTASVEITNQKKAEAALIQSEKLAAVGRLATSISHEINNPLEAITNLMYLIAIDEDLPPSIRTYVSMAQSELGRVSQIATQTLRFHRQAVAPTAVSPAELVNAVIQLYTGRLANSRIKVETDYRTETKILCFENDIRQVLNNLIANAIDAMRTGGRLLVRAHETSFPVPGVRISIADTGHGMEPQVVARIFEPFYTTKDLNGTGLGLWISAGIMERHQGRIYLRSSTRPERRGTVFTLFLPCEETPA